MGFFRDLGVFLYQQREGAGVEELHDPRVERLLPRLLGEAETILLAWEEKNPADERLRLFQHGQFRFDDYAGTYRGISLVLGGVVQKTMGIFGQPSSNTGFERDWVYDERFRYRALSPPAFPGFPNITGATSLGIDSYTWRLGLF